MALAATRSLPVPKKKKDDSWGNLFWVIVGGYLAYQFLKSAGSSARAREYNGASRPILVLLDLKMPRVDGFEVLRQAKQDANLKSIPIIVLTTSDRENDVEKAFKLGCNAYLVKPVQFPAFIKTMLEVKEFWLTISTLPKPED